MLISDEYTRLNTELHTSRPDYGSYGHKWKWRVYEVAEKYSCHTLLDYGCGKSTLAKVLKNLNYRYLTITEYDPAIEGKTETVPSDLVVCTDVLEHIEPENLNNVLQHIQKMTKKVLFFCISTRLAGKVLSDGRNPHLSLHTALDWQNKLDQYFKIDYTELGEDYIVGAAAPRIYQIDSFNTFSVLDESERLNNVRLNVVKTLRRLPSKIEPHGREASLVCFGPSLKSSWMNIPIDQYSGDDIFTVSGAHQFLIDRSIKPNGHIDCDPRAYKSEQMGTPVEGVKYWVASCVDPTYVEKLRPFDLTLWHLWNGEPSAPVLDEIEPGSWALQGGGCIGLRALALLYTQGYRKIKIHGMDCSQSEDDTHAGKHLGKFQTPIQVRYKDRWFKTTGALASYAQQFFTLRDALQDAKFSLYGDGLLQHMVKG